MAEIALRSAPPDERDAFTAHFQHYLRELANFNGARPNRNGIYEYGLYRLYWKDDRFRPYFLECDGRRAGLLLLRELGPAESPRRTPSLQVAELYVFRPFRRRGVAREAMRQAAARAESMGVALSWSAYMNNGPAVALYRSILEEFGGPEGGWRTERKRGVDASGLARYYYWMEPIGVPRP
jgi:predicted acetyltransferase